MVYRGRELGGGGVGGEGGRGCSTPPPPPKLFEGGGAIYPLTFPMTEFMSVADSGGGPRGLGPPFFFAKHARAW